MDAYKKFTIFLRKSELFCCLKRLIYVRKFAVIYKKVKNMVFVANRISGAENMISLRCFCKKVGRLLIFLVVCKKRVYSVSVLC